MLLALHSRPREAFIYSGTLARVPLVGGAPREILEDVEWADWSPDGTNVAVVHEVQGRKRLEFPLGKVLYQADGWIGNPRVGPDGKVIAFVNHPQPSDDGGAVAVVDLNGKKTELSDGWDSIQGLAWSPDGKEIWFTATRTGGDRSLYATDLAGKVRVLARVPGELTILDVSREGSVLLTRGNDRAGMLGLPPGQAKERDLSWLDWSVPGSLSADGTMVLFQESGEGGGPKYATYLRNTDGSPAIRLGEGSGLVVITGWEVGAGAAECLAVAIAALSDRGGRDQAVGERWTESHIGSLLAGRKAIRLYRNGTGARGSALCGVAGRSEGARHQRRGDRVRNRSVTGWEIRSNSRS